MRTTPNISEELRRLDDAINNKLILSFTGKKPCGNNERILSSLTVKLGGMRIALFYEILDLEFENLSLLAEEQASLIERQKRTYRIEKETINNTRKKIKRERQEYN